MTAANARRRFFEKWIEIVLTVVSIIQGMAFNDLVLRFPGIYKHTLSTGDLLVLAHFGLSFIVLLRIFQTYVAVALDYEQWTPNFFDIFLIFGIGALEYFVFASLEVPDFDPRVFHRRLAVIAVIGVVGYLGALLRLREEMFPSYWDYRREVELQAVNVGGLALCLALSLLVIIAPPLPASVATIVGVCSAAIVAGSIVFSISRTLGARAPEVIPAPSHVAPDPSHTARPRLAVVVRKAERRDVLPVLDLVIGNFGYVYVALFEVSDILARRILKGILLGLRGRHALGYRSYYVATDRISGDVIGVLRVAQKDQVARVFGLIGLARVAATVLRHCGLPGVLRGAGRARDFFFELRSVRPGELEIVHLAVRGDRRTMGVGDELLQFASGLARSRGHHAVTLTVRELNVEGIAFFSSRGFREETTVHSPLDARLGRGARKRMRLDLTRA